MSSSDLAIAISGLSKAYTIRHQEREITLAEQALKRLRRPFTRVTTETFWALRDVDLEVRRGEVLGIIGRNGAGKSTLLKILSRITPPTTGRVELYGRVGSLLEVGTGFHPELTGRENIYLNGTILGMKRVEIDRQFDAIVEFAGVERFLDTPVKRYSSGMYVRLAFAVAAHLETEILIVDEVLAVGDQEFQEKCFGKMSQVTESGRTVVLVSHNLDSITRLCRRAAVLRNGRVHHVDDAGGAVAAYIAMIRDEAADRTQGRRRRPPRGYRLAAASAPGGPFACDEPKRIRLSVVPEGDGPESYFVSAHIVDAQRRVVAHCDSRLAGTWGNGAGEFELELRSPWLKPGRYDVDVFVCSAGVLDAVEGACSFDVLPSLPYPFAADPDSYENAATLSEFTFEERTHDAVAHRRDGAR